MRLPRLLEDFVIFGDVMIRLKLMIGKYYNAPGDDLIVTPAIIFGDANYNDLQAKALAIVWLRWSCGIAWYCRKTV